MKLTTIGACPPRRPCRTNPWTLALLSLPTLVLAQQLPRAGTTVAGSTAPDTLVVLSPFEVNADKDTGYIPERDLSGTRLNTPLRDVAAPITVFTKELLDDIGALTADDVVPFLPNATYETATPGAADQTQISLRIRGLGASNTNLTDGFARYTDLDRYNIERMGIAPGANAILQGVGSPTGTLTASTKTANLGKNAYNVETAFTTLGGARAMVDANQVLLKNRVALRAVGLTQYMPVATEPAYKKDKRLFLAAKATLLERADYKTTIRGNYEWVMPTNNPATRSLSKNNLSGWLEAGSPIRTVANTSTAPTLTGTSRLGTRLIDIPDLPLMNWANTLQTNSTTLLNFDERISPYDISTKGKDGINPQRTYQGAAYLDQQIGRDLFLEIGTFRAHRISLWPIKQSTGITLSADPNALLPDGTPNPNAGKFYIEQDGRTDTNLNLRDAFLVHGVYTFDFNRINPTWGKWLGRHQFYGYYQWQKEWNVLERLQTVNATPLPGFSTNLSNSANRVYHRSYLDYTKGIYWFRAYDFRTVREKNGVRAEALPVLQQTTGLTVNNSRTFAVQSNWWDNRIVTMYGLRWDSSSNYTGKPVQNPVTGLNPLARDVPVTFDMSGSFKPVSKGVVFHALPWLSLTYSQSDNFAGGANDKKDHFGNNLPIPGGATKDYGLRLNLLRDKLTLNLNKYESGRVNDFTSGDEGDITEINRIWDALRQSDKTITPFPTTRETFDNVAKGYELSMTFNPSRNWRFFLSAAKNNTVLTNLYPAFREYVALHESTWLRQPNIVTSSGRTIQEEVDEIKRDISRALSQDGVQEFNLREYTGSFVGAYSFLEGRLKGLKLSATLQYFGDAVVGVPVIDSVSYPDRAYIEKGYTQVGLGLQYSRKLRSRGEWYCAVQVNNALDFDGRVIIVTRNPDTIGRPTDAIWLPGVNARFTTGVRF